MPLTTSKIIAIRDFFTFFYLFPLRKLASLLPVKATRLISIPLVYVYSLLPVSHKRRKSINKKLTFIFSHNKTKQEIKKLSRQCLHNAVYTYLDDLILNKLSKRDLIDRGIIKGIENLENALLDKKGVILISGHFSGNRVSKLLLREMGFPVLSVREKYPTSPSMSLVEKKYIVPVWSKILDNVVKDCIFIEDTGFSIEILRRLRKNGLVSILFDAITSTQVTTCPFFGIQRSFPTNFLQIAKLTDAAIIPMLCIGNSSSFTIIFGKKVELQRLDNKNEFISVNLNRLVKVLEMHISEYPTQWLMM